LPADAAQAPSVAGPIQESLTQVAKSWTRPKTAPSGVKSLLRDSRRLFVKAAESKTNFAAASHKALCAAEHALRLQLGQPRSSLGALLRNDAFAEKLTEHQREWFCEQALYWRNRLSDPDAPEIFSVWVAEIILRRAHEIVNELFCCPQGPALAVEPVTGLPEQAVEMPRLQEGGEP
jgi:hypothetical protein